MNTRTEHTLGLLGQGSIYQQMLRSLENLYQILPLALDSPRQDFTRCRLIIYCADNWSPQALLQSNYRCIEAGVALLPLYTRFDKATIGPCVVPGQEGCARCAEFRKLGATSSYGERELLLQHLFPRDITTNTATETNLVDSVERATQSWLSPLSISMLATLGIEEIHTYLQNTVVPRTRHALLTIALDTLECSRHPFMPLSTCLNCGQRIDDSPELATISLQPCPKPDVSTYRSRQPLASPKEILATYLEPQTGLINSLSVEQQSILPIGSAHLHIETDDENETAQGTGCTFRRQQSMVVSVLEVLERYAGLNTRSKRATIQASYQQLIQDAQPALDPTTLGLHSPEQYQQNQKDPHHPLLVPYHPGLVFNWTWGYSFMYHSPILIPEHCAYYGCPRTPENPAFVYDVSNGCALGNCLEEAIFHGMMEVIERDAFLLTWYAQLSLPRLDLQSIKDPGINILLKRLEQHYGYSIQVFNASLDHALPCLCLLAVDEQQREGMPRAYVVAGSHPQPEQALLRALRELIANLAMPVQHYQQNREWALKMLNDASLVQHMPDHPLIYNLPEAFERLHFLYQSPQHTTFQEAFHPREQQAYEHLDLRDDLNDLIAYYLKRGTDTIIVDQTAPEHLPCGLRCVKVLLPGMLPMTFGHNNRRTNLPRLQQLPVTLGYRSQPLGRAEINPHPHPFF
ncbi:SagD family biosynthesis docking scaffold protein [Dictyobacter vulcani]|uniref:SagD family biosynthesis docking scaffold protein n=1 Tax=Dictyobacter vulcani TaxID=2607529 RepID=A0A5J4KWI6_9CHLR|nr:TOMM precursor leader peptide-binding protein [Dictyobacter vulcani]GER91512.1 SagD family biosynthesis docking scaffold protein [Dictyobacter vulcani]